MLKKMLYLSLILTFIALYFLLNLHFENNSLKSEIIQAENKYQELVKKKNYENKVEEEVSEIDLIWETFEWMNSENISNLTLENYDKKLIDLKEPSFLHELVMYGLNNRLILFADFHTRWGHKDIELCYVLKYKVEEEVHEILIFNDGLIKYKDFTYNSKDLLEFAKALIPIVDETSVEMRNALDVMFNSSIATCSTYKESDADEIKAREMNGLPVDCAVRLRASAYFIKQNMIKVDTDIPATEEMGVTKSRGFRDGEEVNLYIYFDKYSELSHVKLVYKDTEEFYVLKPSLLEDPKIKVFNNIWTGD